MFRRFLGSILPGGGPTVWRKNNIYRTCFLGATIGVLGTTYLSQSTIYGDISGEVDDNDRVKASSTTERALVRHAKCTFNSPAVTGIKRIDVVSVPNFLPRQDAITIRSFTVNSLKTTSTIVGLFDGFGGPETMNYISFPLITRLSEALVHLYFRYRNTYASTQHIEVGMTDQSETNLEPYSEATDRTIKEVFLSLDKDIVHIIPEKAMSSTSWAASIAPLGVASSGASVLLSIYDSDTRILKLALAGNSRAILGRLSENKDVYEVHVLTAEHTLQNPEEYARLSALHPNEHIPIGSQQLTRAFGLAAYKWSRELQEHVHRDYLGDLPVRNPLALPYMTAEPVVTTVEILPGDFLIMGSSGLWNSLTNEEAVGLVGLGMGSPKQWSMPAKGVVEHRELPVHLGPDNTEMHRRWRAEKKFTSNNENAATHLAINALGGANKDLVNALLEVQPPRSWKYRYDINAAVIFFND